MSDAFGQCNLIETEGRRLLLPYLKERSDGALVLTEKGVLARHLQLIAGDALINTPDGRLWAIEFKVEQKHTGNLFLETWSNRNLNDKYAHAMYGSNPGWMVHCRADLLMYYFMDTDDLYTIDLFRLKQWSFGANDRRSNLYRWPEVAQRKYQQPNDAYGRIVPINVLRQELGNGFRECKIKTLSAQVKP